jgi:hypothetical protein
MTGRHGRVAVKTSFVSLGFKLCQSLAASKMSSCSNPEAYSPSLAIYYTKAIRCPSVLSGPGALATGAFVQSLR